MNRKLWLIALILFGAGALVWQIAWREGEFTPVVVSVTVPSLSSAAQAGKAAFDVNCAGCHGINAAGTDKGPPLVHNIYNPGHHADEAFVLAAKRGVRGHHWRFGDMPPQPQVMDEQLAAIVRYVRELQAANGIGGRPHG